MCRYGRTGAAGLDGIDRGLEPPSGATQDLTQIAPGALQDVARLPSHPGEAAAALLPSEVLSAALGRTAVEQIAALQQAEWRGDLAQISPWEYAQYAERF